MVLLMPAWISLRKVNSLPEACNLIVLCSIENFLSYAISTIGTQPTVTKEVPHLPSLEVLYVNLVYIPVDKGGGSKATVHSPDLKLYVRNAMQILFQQCDIIRMSKH